MEVMELNEFEYADKLAGARKKVNDIKAFYRHATVYVLVNIFIIIITVSARMSGGESFSEAFFHFATFSTPFFWGIGLAFHAAKVYNKNMLFSRDWEERQIKKLMEKDKKEADKYR